MAARYRLWPLFIIALVFIAASPLSWLLTHIHQKDDVTAIDYENAVLYQKTYPFHRFAAAALTEGILPHWNPRLHSGTPFLADFSNGVFHPLNAIFLSVPMSRAMALHSFVTLFLGGMFFVLFGRALGLSYAASLIGGIAYAFSGASLAASTRPGLALTVALTPLAFWGLREFKNSGLWPPVVVLGAACALIVLGGGWGLGAIMLGLLAVYALVLLYQSEHDPVAPRLAALGAVVVIALGVSAVQWVPSLPWLLSRSQPWSVFWNIDVAGQAPSDLGSLLRHLFATRAGTLPRLVYVGIPVLLLLPAGLFHQGSKRDVWFFAVAIPATLGLLVVFTKMRGWGVDGRLLAYPAALGASVVAAMGAHRMLAARRANPVWWVGLATVAVAIVLFVLTEPLARSTIVVFIVLLMPALIFRFRFVATVAAFSIAFLLFFDLTNASANKLSHPLRDAPQCYMVYDALLTQAEERALGAHALVATHPLNKAVPENIGMIYPLLSVSGAYVPLTADQERWRQRLFDPVDSSRHLLDVMAARVVITDTETAFDPTAIAGPQGAIVEAFTEGGVRLYVNGRAQPRCYFVTNPVHVDGIDGALSVIADAAFDAAQTVTVDVAAGGAASLLRDDAGAGPAAQEPAPMRTRAAGGGGASAMDVTPPENACAIVASSANLVVVRVHALEPGVTVLADSYAPGWSAALNGVPVPILKANGLFRGVATPAGIHTIAFRYRPPGFYAGLAVSVLTLGALMVSGLRLLWKS